MLIFIFWILVPSLDQYTDLNLVNRLLSGPDENLNITSCKRNIFLHLYNNILVTFFPTKTKHEGRIRDLGKAIIETYNQAYAFLGYFTMTPILMSTFLTMIKCWSLGQQQNDKSKAVYLKSYKCHCRKEIKRMDKTDDHDSINAGTLSSIQSSEVSWNKVLNIFY